MSSSTFNFSRKVPAVAWTRTAALAFVLVVLALAAWELHCRRSGYAPTVNDSHELWAQQRGTVKADSVVVIGDSRAWFDIDLDEMEKGLGRRPVQLALSGSCVFPILENLAQDERFRGTVICSVVPALFFAPAGPPVVRSEEVLAHYRKQTLSERMDLPLAIFLEQRFAFMNMEELTLVELLKTLPIPDRAGVAHTPRLPPYFNGMGPDRQARMIDRCVQPGPFQDFVRATWLPLFTPPPPPPGVTPEQAHAQFMEAFGKRLQGTVEAVKRITARGGRVVFVRFPCSGPLKEHEDRITPRQVTWDLLLKATGAKGIHFEDHPELNGFDCPEWSHLKPEDATLFTRRLVPYLASK